MKKWFSIVLICSLCVIVAFQFIKSDKSVNNTAQSLNSQLSSKSVANFTLENLSDHTDVSLYDFIGKPVILSFWASWCKPCQTELIEVEKFADNNPHIQLLAINITAKDSVKDVKAFVNKHALDFTVLLDNDGEISKRFGAFTIPTTIVLNEKLEIEHEVYGPIDGNYLNNIFSEG